VGYELKFHVDDQDLRRIAANPPGPQSLDEILRAAPGFVGGDSATGYEFKHKDDSDDKWPASVSFIDGGLCVCLYDRRAGSADYDLMTYLMFTLLDICGRVEVSEL